MEDHEDCVARCHLGELVKDHCRPTSFVHSTQGYDKILETLFFTLPETLRRCYYIAVTLSEQPASQVVLKGLRSQSGHESDCKCFLGLKYCFQILCLESPRRRTEYAATTRRLNHVSGIRHTQPHDSESQVRSACL